MTDLMQISLEKQTGFVAGDEEQQVTRGLAKYGRTEAVFQLLYFNLAAYPAGRYKFSQVQIINIKL